MQSYCLSYSRPLVKERVQPLLAHAQQRCGSANAGVATTVAARQDAIRIALLRSASLVGHGGKHRAPRLRPKVTNSIVLDVTYRIKGCDALD